MQDARELIDDGMRYEQGGSLEKALAKYAAAIDATDDPALRAEAWCREASVHRARCAWDEALAAARRAAEAASAAGADRVLAEALNAEAAVYLLRGELAAAVPHLERLLDVTSDDRMRGVALQNLGSVAAQLGEFAIAEQRYAASSECFRRAGYLRGEAFALNNIAAAALDRGDASLAESSATRAMHVAKRAGDQELIGIAMLNAAEAIARRGDLAHAEELAGEAMGYFTVAGNPLRRVECLRLLGDINHQLGHGDTAVRCYELGYELAEQIGAQGEIAEIRSCLDALAGRRAPHA